MRLLSEQSAVTPKSIATPKVIDGKVSDDRRQLSNMEINERVNRLLGSDSKEGGAT